MAQTRCWVKGLGVRPSDPLARVPASCRAQRGIGPCRAILGCHPRSRTTNSSAVKLINACSVEFGTFRALAVKLGPSKATTRTGLGLVLACCVALGSGCERKPEKVEPADKGEAEEVSAAKVETPQSIEERVAAVSANCSVDTQTGVISRCKNNEKQGLVRDINTGKLPRAEVLPVLVAALTPEEGNDEQKQRSIVASKTLESAFRNSWGDKPDQVVTKDIAKKLIEVLPKLPARQATQVIPSVVHAAMLTGQQQELYTMLDALPGVELRASGYAFVLRYGTLSELPKLKSLIQGQEEVVATSAVEALRRVPSPSEEQKQQICELLQSVSTDPRPVVAGKVAAQLVNCGGAAVDALLSHGETQLKKGDLPASFVRAFDLLCLSRGGKVIGTEAQCKKERSFLEAIVANTKLNAEARQAALLGLGLQFPDAETEKLATKYANSNNTDLKAVAQRVVRNVVAKRERANPHAGVTAPGASAAASHGIVSPAATPKAVTPNAAKPGASATTKPQAPSATSAAAQ